MRPFRLRTLVLLALMLLLGSCARMPGTSVTPIKVTTFEQLQSHLLKEKADLEHFRSRGPFEVTVRANHEIRLSSTEQVKVDVYSPSHAARAPLVILLHGFGNSKDDHGYQAMHLATWGLHAVALDLPNKGPWVRNGVKVSQLVNQLRAQPAAIDPRIDPGRVILAGHSFGASSVAIALAEGAPAIGSVLLDPAGIGRIMPGYLSKVRGPVMVIGADQNVSSALDRHYFFRYIREGVAEVSIRDAVHEDAQFALEESASLFGPDSRSTEPRQITFVSALTAAALSLAFTGNLDYAWSSYGDALQNGLLFDPKRK